MAVKLQDVSKIAIRSAYVTNHRVCYIYPNFRLLPFFNVWPRTVDLPVWMCSNTQRKTDACCYFTDCIIVENLLHVFCNERHLVPYPRILLYVHISCKLTQHFPFFVKAQVARAHVSRKSQRLINKRVTRCVTSVLSYGRNRWKFEHVIRNSMGNEIWSICNDKYFEIWIFYS